MPIHNQIFDTFRIQEEAQKIQNAIKFLKLKGYHIKKIDKVNKNNDKIR